MCLDSLPERGRANDHLLLHRFTINHLASGYHKLPSLSSSNEDTEEAVALRLLYLCINCRIAVICKSHNTENTQWQFQLQSPWHHRWVLKKVAETTGKKKGQELNHKTANAGAGTTQRK